jgi:2-iminobutanoate/2-iminopropanoate deaminase
VINASYAKHLREPFPVRTTVQVAALPLGAKVQIDTVVGL